MRSHRVIVMRHAKSSWKDNLPDHERPLSGRGRRDGLAAGQLLVRRGLAPDRLFCSTSVRTRQTRDRLEAAGARVDEVTYAPELYDADAQALLEIVRGVNEEVDTVMLLGHWPAVLELVGMLATAEPSEHWRSMTEKFPTSAIAIVDLPGCWESAGDRSGELVAFDVPRGNR